MKKSTEISKAVSVKTESENKRIEREQENIVKSEIEHEWTKLLDSDKHNYSSYADFIIKKHGTKLSKFPTIKQTLQLSIYAVSKKKFYDRILESYIQMALNTPLNINDYICNSTL